MGLKEDLKKPGSRELSDDELGKVAGGKDWEQSDIEEGQVFLYWESETTNCYRRVIYLYDDEISYMEYRINKTNINDFTAIRYDGHSLEIFVDQLNKNGAYKSSLPSGFQP